MKLVLLPGLDGTGLLFEPLLRVLPSHRWLLRLLVSARAGSLQPPRVEYLNFWRIQLKVTTMSLVPNEIELFAIGAQPRLPTIPHGCRRRHTPWSL
jgi:hypothetical protein